MLVFFEWLWNYDRYYLNIDKGVDLVLVWFFCSSWFLFWYYYNFFCVLFLNLEMELFNLFEYLI